MEIGLPPTLASRRCFGAVALGALLAVAFPTPFAVAGAPGGKSEIQAGGPAVYYTFREGRAGGVAVARIDPASGRIVSQEVLGKSPLFLRPHKIKLSETGRYLLATSQHADKDNLFLGDLATNQHRFLSVDRIPDNLTS
jgi:hypothetical protein